MATKIGKLYICDRCGYEEFVNYLKSDHLDGGYTTVDHFEKPKNGWNSFPQDLRDEGYQLCPKCTTIRNAYLEHFYNKMDPEEDNIPWFLRETELEA